MIKWLTRDRFRTATDTPNLALSMLSWLICIDITLFMYCFCESSFWVCLIMCIEQKLLPTYTDMLHRWWKILPIHSVVIFFSCLLVPVWQRSSFGWNAACQFVVKTTHSYLIPNKNHALNLSPAENFMFWQFFNSFIELWG